MKNANLEKRTSEILDRTGMALHENPVERVNNMDRYDPLTESVKRITKYHNPVELVNNMYGCHPDGKGLDYFLLIYGNL